jgi:hypothetical protein
VPLAPLAALAPAACLLALCAPSPAAGATRSFASANASGGSIVFRLPGVAPRAVRSAELRIGGGRRTLRTRRVRRALRDDVLRVPMRGLRPRWRATRRARLVLRLVRARAGLRDGPRIVRHVTPQGSDSAPGTPEAPWRTLDHAARAAGPGTTVVLAPGDYGRRGTITRLERDGTAGAPITFRGAPGAPRPRILGQLRVDGDHVHVRRVLLDGPTGRVAAAGEDNPGGEDVQLWMRGDGAVLADSEVRGSLWHAGVFVSDGRGIRVERNWIHHNGDFGDPAQSNLDHGVYWSSGSGAVVGNRIERNLAYGVHLYPEGHHVLVARNRISRHGRGGIIVAERAAHNVITANEVTANREGIKSYALTGRGNVVRANRVWGNWEADFGLTRGLALSANRLR